MRIFQSSRQGSDDRLRDLLSPLNLPTLPTGGSKVRLIAIGNPAAVMRNTTHAHRSLRVPRGWCVTAKIVP
jgi:hypothetical protein